MIIPVSFLDNRNTVISTDTIGKLFLANADAKLHKTLSQWIDDGEKNGTLVLQSENDGQQLNEYVYTGKI